MSVYYLYLYSIQYRCRSAARHWSLYYPTPYYYRRRQEGRWAASARIRH